MPAYQLLITQIITRMEQISLNYDTTCNALF